MAGIDFSDAELMDFEIQGKEAMARIRIKDGDGTGSILEIRWTLNNVWRKGNDPNTGAPNYIIQASAPNVRLVSFDKKLRKPALKPPGPAEGTKGTGVG
jgi:hypothetical protein